MDRLEQKIIDCIEQHREEIIETGRDIFTHAEMGYKEYRTAKIVADKLRQLGIEPQTAWPSPVSKGISNPSVTVRLSR